MKYAKVLCSVLAAVVAMTLLAGCSAGAATPAGDASAGDEEARAAIFPEDGEYLMDVTLEGGTGRASISSPTLVQMSDGEATAIIEWSSPNFDYMVVDGERYLPTNDEGNSTFQIPVLAFDEPFSVVADTTAMSQPHEIEYELTFDSSSAR